MSTLDPVQIAALEFAEGKHGVGLFLQQGLGKSLIVLTEFSFLAHTAKTDRMLIITPNTFKQGFVDEIEKHGFDLDIHVFQSSKKKTASEFISRSHIKPPVLICNYEAVRLPNVLKGLSTWLQRGPAYLAIDESIAIKGHRSQQTKAVHKLAIHSKFVRILTGRPMSQGPQDLWGQLRAIGLFEGTNFYAFRGTFCQMGFWPNKVLGAKNPERLAATMDPVVFQAKKKDWLPALPRKDYTIRDYAMSDEQLKQYNQMEHQFLLELERGVITVDVAIAKYAKLAEIMVGFIYDDNGTIHELVKPAENPRLNLLLQLLEEETEGKVCIVYRHRAVYHILLKALAAYDCAWITGGMKPEETSEQKAKFNNDPNCRIILLQIDAAKFGHTLVGSDDAGHCNVMIFFENSYSADARDQVEDRIHRRGAVGENVLYIDLSGSPLDRRIVKALQRKEDLYRSVFKHLKVAEPIDG